MTTRTVNAISTLCAKIEELQSRVQESDIRYQIGRAKDELIEAWQMARSAQQQ